MAFLSLRPGWAAVPLAVAACLLPVAGWAQPEDPPAPQLDRAGSAPVGVDDPSGAVAPTVAGPGAGVDVELGAVGSYVSAPIRGGTNPFGAGFGGRFGLVFSGFYVGASVIDYLGGTDVDVSYRALLYGVEVGYGARLASLGGMNVTLRPLAGLGDAAVYYTDPHLAADVVTSASSAGRSNTLTVNNVYVRPGLVALLSGKSVFAGVEVGALIVPGIAYGGASATTWLCGSGSAHFGLTF